MVSGFVLYILWLCVHLSVFLVLFLSFPFIKILVNWFVVCLSVCFLSREKEKAWSCVRWGISCRRHKNSGGFMGNKASRNIRKCAILPQPTSVVSKVAGQ